MGERSSAVVAMGWDLDGAGGGGSTAAMGMWSLAAAMVMGWVNSTQFREWELGIENGGVLALKMDTDSKPSKLLYSVLINANSRLFQIMGLNI